MQAYRNQVSFLAPVDGRDGAPPAVITCHLFPLLKFQLIIADEQVDAHKHQHHQDAQRDAHGGPQAGVALGDRVAGGKDLVVQVHHGRDGIHIRHHGGKQLAPHKKADAGDGPHGDVGFQHTP